MTEAAGGYPTLLLGIWRDLARGKHSVYKPHNAIPAGQRARFLCFGKGL